MFHVVGQTAGRLDIARDTQSFAQRRDVRHLVAQRFHQALNAISMLGRADQGRHQIVMLKNPRRDRVDVVGQWNLVFDDLLEEPVVEVRQ